MYVLVRMEKKVRKHGNFTSNVGPYYFLLLTAAATSYLVSEKEKQHQQQQQLRIVFAL